MVEEKKGIEALGNEMRVARHQAGLSIDRAAGVSGVGKARISRYENGWVTPSIETLVRLCAAYGLSVSTLLRRADI